MRGRRSALKTLSPAGTQAVARPSEADLADADPERISTPEDDIAASQTDDRAGADGTPERCTTAEVEAMAGQATLMSPAASEAAKRDPAIHIDIDPSVSGSVVRDRYDVLIRGRGLSPASLEEVRLRVGDRTMAKASFGEPERATEGTMPDGTPARQRGFEFNLALQNGGRPELSNFQIVARTVDGFDYAEAFAVELDPTALPPLSVVTGPTRSSDLCSVRPHTMIHVERCTMDSDGILAVEGWAVAMGSISAVQLFIGRQRIAAARLGGEREDVAAAHGEYPGARLSGFSLTLQVEEEDRQAAMICARLICSDGFGHEEAIPIERIDQRSGSWSSSPAAEAQASEAAVASNNPAPLAYQGLAYQLTAGAGTAAPLTEIRRPTQLSPGSAPGISSPLPSRLEAPSEIHMFCDGAELGDDGHLFVRGWAVCAAGIAQVRVLLDEKVIGLAVLGYERADVGAVYATVPMARWSGFRFERRLGRRFEGEHIVRVVVRDTRASKKDESLLVVAMAVTENAPAEAVARGTLVATASALETTADEAAEFRFALESPALTDGAAIDPVTDGLTIDGWLLCRSGIANFSVLLDDQFLGEAHCGLARQDVGAAFPEWPNAPRSGFAFEIPVAKLRDGDHMVALMVTANSGLKVDRRFQIEVRGVDGVRC
jgi:hypothetical protein